MSKHEATVISTAIEVCINSGVLCIETQWVCVASKDRYRKLSFWSRSIPVLSTYDMACSAVRACEFEGTLFWGSCAEFHSSEMRNLSTCVLW
jgi:hypothetical protein